MKLQWRLFGLKVLIGLSLCVYFFFLMLPVATSRREDGNTSNSFLFTRLSQQPFQSDLHHDYNSEFPIWQTRVASQYLSGLVWDTPCDPQFWNGYKFNALSITFATYQTSWLVLLFGLLIHYRRDSILLMLGIFSGLMCNLSVAAGCWWYPWDLPVMCFFTWAILVFLKNEYWPLLVIVFVASLFKETGLTCALLVLFGPWSMKKRIGGFIALVALFFICRKVLMYSSQAATVMLPFNEAQNPMEFVHRAILQFRGNVADLFGFHLNSPWFANCGLLALMFFLPAGKPVKLMVAAFFAGHLFFGQFVEAREMFEILPLGMIQLSDYLKTCDDRQKREAESTLPGGQLPDVKIGSPR